MMWAIESRKGMKMKEGVKDFLMEMKKGIF
jgi:hypothetical protein